MDREPARRFEDLTVWQKSHALTLRVYQVTTGFPREELFGLSAQMRRAAVSVPANIAEGFSKRGRPDKARYMNIAKGRSKSYATTSCCREISRICTEKASMAETSKK